jgi:hypothetical protein
LSRVSSVHSSPGQAHDTQPDSILRLKGREQL